MRAKEQQCQVCCGGVLRVLHSRQEAAPAPLNLTAAGRLVRPGLGCTSMDQDDTRDTDGISGHRYTTMDRGDTRLLLAPSTPPCRHRHLFLVPSAPGNVGLRARGGLGSDQAQG